MMAESAVVPFDETLVKKPGSCPPDAIEGEVKAGSITKLVEVVVWTLNKLMLLPPLVTTRPMPSEPLK
jgi:hypothetical protein